jgi:hypothetical protein
MFQLLLRPPLLYTLSLAAALLQHSIEWYLFKGVHAHDKCVLCKDSKSRLAQNPTLVIAVRS